MRNWLPLIFLVFLFSLGSCAVGVNGVGVSTGQQYFSPYGAREEGTAVVYIYWNQSDIGQYIPFSARKPSWNTYVNRKKNAELEEGSYSVVEVNPGRVRIEARIRFGSSPDFSDRSANIGLGAKAGEIYFVSAKLIQGSLGLELVLDREISERNAYDNLYGLRYQENLQESMLY